ncbi:GNAT family N-acetyltransferase [Yimella sp. RIT 621]|uniref:GNAT family N-acetyltransferase n=1 Tax=Yimella sp. RIT 621 TaxID=2510323 RepID=UPI00145A0222|nr:N-acetyltransferase [Yimella sp. RIT 621]
MTEAFESHAEADLVDRIRTGSEYRPDMALVAVEADQIVGHVMIDGCWVRGEHGDREILMLSPLAVLPSHQQHGIGSTLIKAALDAAGRARGITDLLRQPRVRLRRRHGLALAYPRLGSTRGGPGLPAQRVRPTGHVVAGTVVYRPRSTIWVEPPTQPVSHLVRRTISVSGSANGRSSCSDGSHSCQGRDIGAANGSIMVRTACSPIDQIACACSGVQRPWPTAASSSSASLSQTSYVPPGPTSTHRS